MRIPRTMSGFIATIAATCALAVTAPGTAFAQDGTVTTAESVSALQGVSGLLAESDFIRTTTDGDSAAQTDTLDVPKDAASGIEMKSDQGPDLTVALPNADENGTGQIVAPGTISYPSSGDSTNAVQALEGNKGARLLTVIENRKADTRYTYNIQSAGGVRVELASDGSAFIIDKNDDAVAAIAKPWAKDANGRSVKTRYVAKGASLTQIVQHRAKGIAYPVVADPQLVWGRLKLDVQMNRRETNNLMFGGSAATGVVAWIPWPYGPFLAGVVGFYAGYANWAYNNGGCMKFNVTYWGSVWASHYYGGNCR